VDSSAFQNPLVVRILTAAGITRMIAKNGTKRIWSQPNEGAESAFPNRPGEIWKRSAERERGIDIPGVLDWTLTGQCFS
jgi:hypothetical protein